MASHRAKCFDSRMTALTVTPVTCSAQIARVAELAQIIWNEHYLEIIGQAQIDYMLARFQRPAAIAEQIAAGDAYFLLSPATMQPTLETAIGYLALRVQASRVFISKLYVLKACRGQGYGRAALEWVAAWARARRVSVIWLTVNKYNPALHAYLKIGFIKTAEVVTDIGAGYVMDDYQLEWQLEWPLE